MSQAFLCRRAAAFAVLAAAILAAGPAAVAMTIQEYLDEAKAPADEAALASYLDGLRDGLYDYNTAMAAGGVLVFCPPEGAQPLPTDEFRQAIGEVLEQRRIEDSDFLTYAQQASIGLVGLEALTQRFSCEPGEADDMLPGEEEDGAALD